MAGGCGGSPKGVAAREPPQKKRKLTAEEAVEPSKRQERRSGW